MLELVVAAFAGLVVLGVLALCAGALGLVSVRELYQGRTDSLAAPAGSDPVDEDDPADPAVR